MTLTDASQTPLNQTTAHPLRQARGALLFLALGGLALAASVIVGTWVGSDSTHLSFQDGLDALDRGDLAAVTSAVESLQAQGDHDQQVRLLTGAWLMRGGDPAAALEYFAGISPEGELRTPLLLLTGECLYRLRRLAEALVPLQQLVRENPDQVEGHRWLGAIYYDLGANDAAVSHLLRVAELAPGDYRPHRLLGLMYLDFSRNTLAIEYYEQALALAPPAEVRGEIVRELARALIAEREYESALAQLADAPDEVDVLALRGECYWHLGDHTAARDCLRRARADGGSHRLLDLLAARIELADGAPSEAASILTAALERDPHDAECRYQLAMCWRQMGDEEQCSRELERWQTSKRLLEELTRLNAEAIERPGDADVRDELAAVCDELGKSELAAMWRQAAENCRNAGANAPRASDDVAGTATLQTEDTHD